VHEGTQSVDPTKNVLREVDQAIRRQDDLRELDAAHLREMVALRADYDEKLRRAETARIDAIRAVDVGAVNRAAEVSAQQATTLAVQVAQSAETLRTQVAAAATAATVALAAALEPIQKDIADLRRAQYEAQGVKTQGGEQRLNLGTLVALVVAVIAVIGYFTK
jgi:CHAT domain-containing protein